jgi:type IV secretory pathway VirB4 component
VVVEEQDKVVRAYRSQLRKMEAAQRDGHGFYKTNVEAKVSHEQVLTVLEGLQSSSVKACQYSMVLSARTSEPAYSASELDQAQKQLSERTQKLTYTVARMAGARAMTETVAKRRIFIGALPGLGSPNRRELDCLTSNAADLLPLEVPWGGMPQSPLVLLETPYRQLVPFSPWDPSLSDANLLIIAKSGGGKTFLSQQLLLMMARARPLISILEKGDSYRPLVELMGGENYRGGS